VKRLAPFFKYFGSKNLSARKYPEPLHSTIVEPFSGGAGYSLNYWDRDVVLYDADQRVVDLWKYLIGASKDEILSIPLMEFGQKISSLDVSDGARLLLSCWVNTSPFCTQMSGWGGKLSPRFWGEWARSLVANQVENIRHWRAICADYSTIIREGATWFIDPPYVSLQKHYQYSRKNPIDFDHLGTWCKSLPGQVIVCEKEGAEWLPFRYLGQASSVRNANAEDGRNSRKCCEVIWTNQPPKQPGLFDTKETP
jgi:site-specific DNA-adenine methylase